jgi:hypothetical protein
MFCRIQNGRMLQKKHICMQNKLHAEQFSHFLLLALTPPFQKPRLAAPSTGRIRAFWTFYMSTLPLGTVLLSGGFVTPLFLLIALPVIIEFLA